MLVKVDARAEENQALRDAHGVWLYPSFVVLNAQGEPLASWAGFADAEAWSSDLGRIAADPITLAKRRARLIEAPTFVDALVLGEEALRSRRLREAEQLLRQAQALDPQAAAEEDVLGSLLRTAFYGFGSDYGPEEATAILTEVLASSHVTADHAIYLSSRLYRAVRRGDAELTQVAPLLQKAYPLVESAKDDSHQEHRQSVLADHAVYVEQDPEKGLRLRRAALPDDWESDADELNGLAWWCFERRVHLAQAETWARQAVEAAPAGPSKANALDTLAQILHLRGETRAALTLIEEALELDPGSSYLKEQRDRFTEILEGSPENEGRQASI